MISELKRELVCHDEEAEQERQRESRLNNSGYTTYSKIRFTTNKIWTDK